jgi:hypothetical protein
MREDTKLNVYRLKKDKITNEVEKIKIGEAKVSNLIFDNSCWVVLDLDDNIKPQIGDMVIPSFNYSFWDLFTLSGCSRTSELTTIFFSSNKV